MANYKTMWAFVGPKNMSTFEAFYYRVKKILSTIEI